MVKETNNTYEDIIHLPYSAVVKKRTMSMEDRAAQFAPFAALTGHEEAVRETARLTEKKIQLDEGEIAAIQRTLSLLGQRMKDRPWVTIVYFVPDLRKDGGRYVKVYGMIKKIEKDRQCLIMEDEKEIFMEDIVKIDCELLDKGLW